MQRREVLRAAMGLAAAGVAAELRLTGQAAEANDRITIAVMGVRGRGGALLTTFAAQSDVDVKYICDVDAKTLESRVKQVQDMTGKRPEAIADYRRVLDDAGVDALVIGAPDHWHALPTIHACQARKDVYVEKPDGHNILEGCTMVAAARKYERVVQLGTQARSGTFQKEAMAWIAEGHLGKVRFAKAWESAGQGAIGYPPDGPPPEGVDYDRWLGPAPNGLSTRAAFTVRGVGSLTTAPVTWATTASIGSTWPAGRWRRRLPPSRDRSPHCRQRSRRTAASITLTTRRNGRTH